ncbi:MAG TPA: glycosyltransferase family 2 protein [Patescibacteria group bacterium]|nr:glycosyltransferase family 2 protein [Patescibacteria group bacterium]
MKFDLSINILTYKYGEKIKETLASVFDSITTYSYEVIVVDNDSKDGIGDFIASNFKEQFVSGKLRFIQNARNTGFGAGHNTGIKAAAGTYVLMLNADTKVSTDTLQVMMDFMKSRPDVGIATCRLVKEDGTDDLAARRRIPDPWVAFTRLAGLQKLFPKSKYFGGYNLTYKSPDEAQEVECCVGAFMLVSPACLGKTKGFDEDFFMYGEDIDWCLRARKAGFKIWYYPKARTIHYKGSTSRKVSSRALFWFHESMWIFYRKHFYHHYPKLFSVLIYLGVWGRYCILRFVNSLRKDPYVSK